MMPETLELASRVEPCNGANKKEAKFRFCLTLDTEPDDLSAGPTILSYTHFARLEEFHQRITDAGGRSTYLTTSEVAESAMPRQVLQRCLSHGSCEIGAHFHTWTRDWPFPTPGLNSEPRPRALAHQLGRETEERMLAFTCQALRMAFDLEPKSHRGGRWSLGPHSPKSLANCGIDVDSTVTPGLSWRDSVSTLVDGPDFSRAQRSPYYLHYLPPAERERVPKQKGILELPVGAAWFPHACKYVLRRRVQVNKVRKLSKLLRVRLGHRYLRPTGTSLSDLKATIDDLHRCQVPVWVMMIHSSEIIPCKAVPTQERVEEMIARCVDVVRYAVGLGAQPATLSEAAEWVRANDYAS